MQLQRVNIIGKQGFHVYYRDSDGRRVEVSITHQEYIDRRDNVVPFPEKLGHTGNMSYETHLYDTPDGQLGEGQVAHDPSGQTSIVRLPGQRTIAIIKDEMDVDRIRSKGIERANRVNAKMYGNRPR